MVETNKKLQCQFCGAIEGPYQRLVFEPGDVIACKPCHDVCDHKDRDDVKCFVCGEEFS